MLGECVPGGTTTALCVLRALGYDASVSSAFPRNPIDLKEGVCREVLARIRENGIEEPMGILRAAGDPMMPVAAGIVNTYSGDLIFAGGTQMLAVAAVLKALGRRVPRLTRRSMSGRPSAGFTAFRSRLATAYCYVDPEL